ncbi:MAG: SpoIID/LytB domain-containing protein [Planctomycetes bacterium]|nr:SpoIID/LytB domain-containing protein [Planctomycetota bacterium]
MIRWFLKLVCLAALAFGFYHIAFHDAPDLSIPAAGGELLAANMPGRGPVQPEVRVLVADALDHATLTINGKVWMQAVTMQMNAEDGTFTQSVAVEVTPTGQGVRIGTDHYVRVRMKNLDSQPLRLTWRNGNEQTTVSIPHEIEIYGTHVVDGNRKIPRVRVLARLPMEEYLYGVVAGEVPSNWPLEALRAQAVASRTFAYFEVKSRRNEEYDVHASTRSQVWRPSLAVEPQVRRAVDSTAGIVITEKNALI